MPIYMERRIEIILKNILELASGNFELEDYKVEVNDSLDVIGAGVAMLAEQLNSSMVSKIELILALEEKDKALNTLLDYQMAIDKSSIVVHTDLKGTITNVNDQFCNISKYSREELIGKNQNIVNSGHHSSEFWKEMWQTIGRGNVWRGKIKNKTKDGSFYWVFTTIVPFKERGRPHKYLAIRQDITHLVETEELVLKNIKASLEEKNVLLKEIHHRVKNNMQVITSLLGLQSSFIKDEKVVEIFRASQNRINAMAMVHEMLYQTEKIAEIDYKEYLLNMVQKLIVSFKGKENNIILNLDMDEIHFNIDTAVPLSLLINEIITNSLKYGVLEDNSGIISIELKIIDSQNYHLKIGDNGIGFDESSFDQNADTLGMKLISRLGSQLNGDIKSDVSKKGVCYTLEFQQIKPVI